MPSGLRRSCAAALAALLTTAWAHGQSPALEFPGSDTRSCRQVMPAADPPPVWISPSPTDRPALSRWCETVGPVFYQPHPASDSRGPIDRLAIVSWNIHEGGGDVDDLIRRLRHGEFTGGEPVDQFVLLLQEATRRDPAVPARIRRGYPAPRSIPSRHGSRDTDIRRLAADGLAVLYAPSMRNSDEPAGGGGGEDRGNAIISTLPLADPRLIELPLERQRRVAAAAAVEGRTSAGGVWRLDVVNVHLDTAVALWRGGPFAARRRQTAALLHALRPKAGVEPNSGATVVAGDFNTWNGDREPAVTALKDAFPGTPGADRTRTWTGPLGLHARLDHIFVRGAVSPSRVTRLPSRLGSDHFPLLTVLRFGGN